MSESSKRAFIVVFDSLGVGEMPDAKQFGDEGTHTLRHIAEAAGLTLPNLQALGLGNITEVPGVPPAAAPSASFGKLHEASVGKDTSTGHWEFAGLVIDKPFPTFPDGFPPEIMDEFARRTGRGWLANYPASGTEIIAELGDEHVRTGKPIVYTSADSVFQIAAHEQVIPLDELYEMCRIAREILDPYQLGRVIARPFEGESGHYVRTANRHDYSYPPPQGHLLDLLHAVGVPVVGVGKIPDIYAHRGFSDEVVSKSNRQGMEQTTRLAAELSHGLVFTNLVDFDMLYGHRRDAQGYARALVEADAMMPALLDNLRAGDLLIITSDHGNDPTFMATTDHTREYGLLLAYAPGTGSGRDLGIRATFADVGATVADWLGVDARLPHGTSFAGEFAG